jgi:hypothetical protein
VLESPHAEAYRVLRTNMQFTNKGVQGGAFAVVSGGVGEGKSTTLFNLAFVCAQLGDKVLVVDSDLRRPVQHTFVGLSNRFGLTNVLMRDVPLEEAIKATSIPNLHFLPSGKLPRAALGLLDSTRMRELVKSLKARYDYVFFDSPPIVGRERRLHPGQRGRWRAVGRAIPQVSAQYLAARPPHAGERGHQRAGCGAEQHQHSARRLLLLLSLVLLAHEPAR